MRRTWFAYLFALSSILTSGSCSGRTDTNPRERADLLADKERQAKLKEDVGLAKPKQEIRIPPPSDPVRLSPNQVKPPNDLKPPHGPKVSMRTQYAAGRVSKVTATTLMIERDGAPTVHLEVNRSTEVLIDWQPSTIAELTPGVLVKVEFYMSGNQAVARNITTRQESSDPQLEPSVPIKH